MFRLFRTVLPLLIAGGEEPESSLPGLFLPRRRPDAGVTISSAASSHNLSGGFLYSLSDPVVSPVLLASNDPSVPLSAAPGIEQDGNILRVTTISSNFTGASTELILQGSDGFGTDLAQHLGSKLVMSAAVSGVFFGQLTDWDRTGAAEPATLLGDPTRSPWSKALPRSVEELGWEGPVVQDSNLQTISLRFATKTTSGLTVNLQRNSCPWVLTDGLPALGRIDVTNSTALDVNWTAMVEAVRVAEFDGVLGLSLWRSAADKRNFLDDLLDAVRPGEEVHVGAFEPRNGTAWWQARVGKEHIHKLPIVPSGNNAELEEWATHFDAVWTLDGIGGGMVNRSGVKVIVDPGPMILTNQDEASILLTSDLFDALNKAFTAAVAKSQIAGSPCDHLPALVFEKDAKVVFRLTSNSLCGCGGGKWWPSCALKVGKLVDGGSNATIRLGHAIADEYGHPDAYFLSYRGQQQTPELVIDTGGASLAFEPPKLTAAVRNHSLTVNFSANSVSLDMLGGEVGMFPPQTATPVSLRGWQASEHHFDSLPLGLRDPEAAPGEKSYLQKLLDRAQTRDPLADSVNFLWDQTSGQLKFSNTMSTSIWAAANPLATEPPLLGVPQQGASVLSFPVEAVPGGGWGLRVFAEDASLDPLQNPTGVNASDLMDKPKRLLLQAAGNVAWKTESQLLAIDYAGGRNLVVNEDIFHRVTDAWEKVLGVKKPSDTNSCEKLKVTIKYKLQTTQNLGRVNLTATGRGIRVATPQFLGQSEEGGIIEVTAQDFCECGGAAGKGCRLLLTSAGLSPAGLRLNSAVLQRLGRMEFAFTGDDNPAFVFVSADNYALFSSYQHALADAFQQAISRASNFPPHINCPWATEDPRQTLRSSPGLWPSVRGRDFSCNSSCGGPGIFHQF